jgi:hypothetical protein
MAEAMSPREKALRRRCRDDLPFFAEKCLKVRTKAGPIESLKLNAVQIHIDKLLNEQLAATGKVRAVIVKGRKQGCSTYIAARHYQKVTHHKGRKAYILTHLADATDVLFGMVERFHEHNNPLVKPQTGASNASELAFPVLDSEYKVGTAGSANVGRADTIQYFHGSEVSFWPKAEDHAAGILEAIPNSPGTEIILESTVNGLGNFFHQTWRDAVAGKNGYIAIFIPWFWSEEYREPVPEGFVLTAEDELYQAAHGLDLQQMAWRQLKTINLKSDWKFMQEFPATPEEAFQASGEGCYIPPVLVAKARRTRIIVQPYIPIIIGIDPARGGSDRTGVIDRQGRKAGGHVNEAWHESNIERLCGKVVGLIKRIKPKKVVIDATEGFGAALCDMLNELGYSTKPGKGQFVVPFKYSGSPIEEGLYLNCRAEVYAALLEWLSNPMGVELPEMDDDLQAEICAAIWGPTATHHTRSGLLQIESKEQIRKRLKRSPDKSDALAQTFAVQIVAAKPEGPAIPVTAVDPSVNY